jgi:hypothetical protein
MAGSSSPTRSNASTKKSDAKLAAAGSIAVIQDKYSSTRAHCRTRHRISQNDEAIDHQTEIPEAG